MEIGCGCLWRKESFKDGRLVQEGVKDSRRILVEGSDKYSLLDLRNDEYYDRRTLAIKECKTSSIKH